MLHPDGLNFLQQMLLQRGRPRRMPFGCESGNYLCNIPSTVDASDGSVLVDETWDGPWLMIDLPSGAYLIRSETCSVMKISDVTLGDATPTQVVIGLSCRLLSEIEFSARESTDTPHLLCLGLKMAKTLPGSLGSVIHFSELPSHVSYQRSLGAAVMKLIEQSSEKLFLSAGFLLGRLDGIAHGDDPFQ